ncbi:MAG: hypothetical protein Q4P24_13775, partial [Rhodobacterales bacterium]|nr:hypothetical protein [Rhodobacterales bacterium]
PGLSEGRRYYTIRWDTIGDRMHRGHDTPALHVLQPWRANRNRCPTHRQTMNVPPIAVDIYADDPIV